MLVQNWDSALVTASSSLVNFLRKEIFRKCNEMIYNADHNILPDTKSRKPKNNTIVII